MWIMILGTYANLYAMEQSTNLRATATTSKLPSQLNNIARVLPEGMIARPGELKHPENLLDVEGEILSDLLHEHILSYFTLIFLLKIFFMCKINEISISIYSS